MHQHLFGRTTTSHSHLQRLAHQLLIIVLAHGPADHQTRKEIQDHRHVQPDLFGDVSLYDYYRKAKLMAVVDAINAIYGRDSLFFAVQGSSRPWKMRQSKLSGRFTTQWSEILTIE
jgi:hypothetical protein